MNPGGFQHRTHHASRHLGRYGCVLLILFYVVRVVLLTLRNGDDAEHPFPYRRLSSSSSSSFIFIYASAEFDTTCRVVELVLVPHGEPILERHT